MDSKAPLFSLILPCYNASGRLGVCLTSLAEQSSGLDLFEVLIIDDCSTDNTLEVAAKHKDRFANFRIIALETNGGPGHARNAGLDVATGEWILFIDSDDELVPHALETLAKIVRDPENANCDAVSFNWSSTETSQKLNNSPKVGRRDDNPVQDRDSRLREYLSLRMDGSVIFTATKRHLIEQHGLRFAGGLHEDIDYIFNIYHLAGPILYTDEVIYLKHNHADSIINNISERHIEGFLRGWKRIGETLQSLPESEREELIGHFSYGTIGVIATRAREIARHCDDEERASALFEKLFELASPLLESYPVRKQLARCRTLYGDITRLFLSAMQDQAQKNKSKKVLGDLKKLKGKSWSCVDLHHSLFMRADEVRTCCKRFFVDGEMQGDGVLYKLDGDRKDTKLESSEVLAAKRDLHQKINSGVPNPCDGCPFLEFREWGPLNDLDINYLSLEYHSICNLRCTYCSDEYYGGKPASYDVTGTIESLLDNKALENCSVVVWGGGEPTVGKDFAHLATMMAEKLPKASQRFLSNSVRKSDLVKDLLDEKKAQLVTSIDAGSESMFEKIRGSNKLREVCKSLQFYAQDTPERVTVKYIFTEGNGDENDVRQFVDLMEEHGLMDCTFQISGDFKKEEIEPETAANMMLMYGLLSNAGGRTIFFDELLWFRLVEQDVPALIDQVHKTAGFEFIARAEKYPKIAIWGAGRQAKQLIKKSHFLRNTEIAYFVDSTPEKQGTRYHAKDVHPPEKLLEEDLPVVIAAVQAVPLIMEKYVELGADPKRVIRDLIV